MRGLTASGDSGNGDRDSGRDDGPSRGHGRLLTSWAACTTTLVGLTAFGLLAVGCSTGGTGTRDEGPAGTQPVARITPSADQSSTAKPTPRIDPVAMLKHDPEVGERVRTDLKPCSGSEYPVDASYGSMTDAPSADVVVNVMTCGDSVGVGTYVYRPKSNGTYENVFAMEQPAVYGTIDRGDLVVTAQVYEKKDSVAYPSGEEVITYRWADNRFSEHDRVHNDFNRAVGNGEAGLPESAEPAGN